MNDEIKEMTKVLKSLGNKQASELYYYITNLQQENQELNDSITWWNNRFNAVQRDYEDYKSRIEKAVEYINHLSKEPNAFGHYGIHNDCAKWLLDILNGKE